MSGSDELSHLVKMANQIARNIGIGPSEDDAAARVADHIKRFWAPRMREKIGEHYEQVSSELSPIARKAVAQVIA